MLIGLAYALSLHAAIAPFQYIDVEVCHFMGL